MEYKDQLKDPRWDKFRKDVYRRANYRCQLCGVQGVALDAHHSYYEAGRMVWEYPQGSVIALCRPCHFTKAHGTLQEGLENAELELIRLNSQVEFTEALYKQFIAYIVATKLSGAISISDKDFSPIEDDFIYQYSYNENSGIMTISGAKFQPLNGCLAYGIKIFSGDNIPRELLEMANFAKLAKQFALTEYVNSIEYDSKVRCCSFTFSRSIDESSVVANNLFSLAHKSISQFEWFGSIQNGQPVD